MKNKGRILLTGGTGMVGRNILEHSKSVNWEILAPSSQDLDLKSYDSVVSYLADYKPEVIIHAAGRVGGIHANMADPVRFLVDNTDMGRNLILSAAEVKVPKVLNLGSSCMYPRDAENPIKESALLTGLLEPTNEGYALAKMFTAKLCQYIGQMNTDLKYKTIIPCNLFGRHDHFSENRSHLIAAIIKKIDTAKENDLDNVEIWGDGKARREFMSAFELADFIYYALENYDECPDYINVGLGKDYMINEYYKAVADVVGYRGEFYHDLTKPVGMLRKCVCVEKLHAFGWCSKQTLQQSLKQAYEYYLKECKL